MIRVDGKWRLQCAHEGCEETVPQGDSERLGRWHKLRASAELGWFFQKDGKAWCPAHVPEWVEGWRAKNKKED